MQVVQSRQPCFSTDPLARTPFRTPLTLFKRLRKDGLKGAREALANWKPWIPTKKGQVRKACLTVNTKYTFCGRTSRHLRPCEVHSGWPESGCIQLPWLRAPIHLSSLLP